MMRIHTITALLLAGLFLMTGSGPVHAGDEDEDKPAALSTRLYPVGGLTNGRYPFTSHFPRVQQPDDMIDSEPYIGADVEEPFYPLGMVDELIELIRGHVDPAYWEETEGVDVRRLGERGLLVRAAAGVHADLARYLATLERRHLHTVTVEVQAVRLTAKQQHDLVGGGTGLSLDAEKVAALLATKAAGPSARITTENRMPAESFGGSQRAFLQRHDPVSAETEGMTVPVAGVANPGFAVSVQPTIHADGRSVRVRFDASLSSIQSRLTLESAKKQVVELPAAPLLEAHADVVLSPGTWALAHGSTDGWSLLVRATPSATTGFDRRAASITLDAKLDPRPGPMEVRDFDVSSLAQAIEEVYGKGAFLYDTSSDGPPEYDRPEPAPPLAADALVEMIRDVVGTHEMWEDPASIEARSGILIVRNTKAVLAAVDAALDRLRREIPKVFVTTVEVVEVSPLAAKRMLRSATRGGEAWLLDAEGRAALDDSLAKDHAKRLDGGRILSLDGARNILRSGRRVDYLSTYEAVRRGKVAVIRPVRASCLSGLELDLRATLTPGGQAAHLAVRCMRTRVQDEVRKVKTVHGEVELPEVETMRLRTNVTVPLDRTAIVGSASRNGKSVFLLLTPRIQRRTR